MKLCALGEKKGGFSTDSVHGDNGTWPVQMWGFLVRGGQRAGRRFWEPREITGSLCVEAGGTEPSSGGLFYIQEQLRISRASQVWRKLLVTLWTLQMACVSGVPAVSTALQSPQSSEPSPCAHSHADVRVPPILGLSLPSGCRQPGHTGQAGLSGSSRWLSAVLPTARVFGDRGFPGKGTFSAMSGESPAAGTSQSPVRVGDGEGSDPGDTSAAFQPARQAAAG